VKSVNIIKKTTGISISEFNSFLTSVERYPEYVPYLQKVIIKEKIAEGSVWFDITKILWIPMKFKHTTLEFEKKKKMSFQVHIPFGGRMEQSYEFDQRGKIIVINAQAKFHLGNPMVHIIVGPILKNRLQKMMEGMLLNIQKTVPNSRILK